MELLFVRVLLLNNAILWSRKFLLLRLSAMCQKIRLCMHLSNLTHLIFWARQRPIVRQWSLTSKISKRCGTSCFQMKSQKWGFIWRKNLSWALDPKHSRNWWRISRNHSLNKSVVLLKGKLNHWVSITISFCSQTWLQARQKSIGLKFSWLKSKTALIKMRQQSVLASGWKSQSRI